MDGSKEWESKASPMSSLMPKPSSMVTPSWIEPMNVFTVSGFTFDLAAVIRDLRKTSWRWIRPKSLVPSYCQYPLA